MQITSDRNATITIGRNCSAYYYKTHSKPTLCFQRVVVSFSIACYSILWRSISYDCVVLLCMRATVSTCDLATWRTGTPFPLRRLPLCVTVAQIQDARCSYVGPVDLRLRTRNRLHSTLASARVPCLISLCRLRVLCLDDNQRHR